MSESTFEKNGDALSTQMEDRRIQDRRPLSCRVLLTPVDERAAILVHENVTTTGEDFSRGGARFSHDFLLTQHRFLLSFRDPELGGFVVEAEVVWTRETEVGKYETGCRIVRKMITPPRLA